MNIGFFDSGVGGLHVLRSTIALLPLYNYVFLGDTVNVPYGDKSEDEVYALTKASLEALFERDCRLVIFACNTASVSALRRLQDEFIPARFPDRKVLGVIIPTVEAVIALGAKRVGIIATERTIRSGKYERELKSRDAKIEVYPLPTPTLVPLIEAGATPEAATEAVALVREKLLPRQLDTLILGCTHYGLLKGALREAFPDLRILAQEEIVPEKLKDYLEKHPEVEKVLGRDGRRDFFLSQVTPRYAGLVREWLGDFPLHPLHLP